MRLTIKPAKPNAKLPLKRRPNRRERHRTETRERIFRAALQLFAERGYMETTVEDITEAADVGKGTFFNYFPTKEHVLAEYGEERVVEVERALQRARDGQEPVLSVLRELATDLAGQSSENPELLRSVFAANLSCAPVRAELHKRIHRARGLMSEIFAIGQRRGEIRHDLSASELGRLIRLIFMGVTIAWAVNPESSLRGTAEKVWGLISPNLEPRAIRGQSAKDAKTARS